MHMRLSYAEKGKGLASPPEPPRSTRVRIPAVDTSELIKKHSLTLVGRITNPNVQRMWSLIPFFSEHWKVETSPVGADLGHGCFQFQFSTEKDLQKVLDERPYHFARWMIILQRWEPIASPTFPNQIPFWIQVQGIPLHLWSDIALTTLARNIGTLDVVEIASTKARMRVFIDGLKPLIKEATLEFDSGEEARVTLVYEKLEKHCTACCMLDHEIQNCPSRDDDRKSDQARDRERDKQWRPSSDSNRQREVVDSRPRPPSRDTYHQKGDHPRDQYYSGSKERPGRPETSLPGSHRGDPPLARSRRVDHPYSRPGYSNYYTPRELNVATSNQSREFRRHDNPTSDKSLSQSSQRTISNRQMWVEKPTYTRRDHTHSSTHQERSASSKPPPPTAVAPPQTEAFHEAVSEVRQYMSNYANCSDPTESAARKERVRQAEEAGEMEETAALMLSERAPLNPTLENQTLLNNSPVVTPTRISARLRLGPIREDEEETEPSPLLRNSGAPKRKPTRRAASASPLNFLGVGVRRRVIAKTQPSPLKRRTSSTIPRLGENPHRSAGSKGAGTSTSLRKSKTSKIPLPSSAVPQRNKRSDFRDPPSLLP